MEVAEVGVGQGGGCSCAFLRVGEQHALQEVDCGGVDVLVGLASERKLHLLVFAVDLLVLRALEERSSRQQNMEDDSSREDIALRFDMFTLRQFDDLRGDIAGRSTPEKQVLLDICMRGQAVIDDDGRHRPIPTHHDVLRLEIAVHDPLLVHPLQPPQQAQHELLHLFL